MAKRRSRPNYYNKYRKKYSEAKKLLNQISKIPGAIIDSEFYQDVLLTQAMDYKEGYHQLQKLMRRDIVLSKTYIKSDDGTLTTLNSDLFDRLMSVPRSYEFDSEVEYNATAPAYAEIAVRNFQYELGLYESLIVNKSSAQGTSKLREWFDEILETHGVKAVGTMLMQASEHGIQLSFEVMYDETSATNFINEMLKFLQENKQTKEDEEIARLAKEITKSVFGEINDGERLAEDEDGNPIT